MPQQYDWYETTEDSQVLQGDFVSDCPVLMPPRAIDVSSLKQASSVEFDTYNVVVMSQSCDLAQKKVDLVLVCPHWSLEELKTQNPDLAVPKVLEEIRRGNSAAYHMIAECDLSRFESGCRVVGFRDVYSVHIEFLKSHVAGKTRLRLLPPYREHLSQAFARFFMRVGLPLDIPKFT